MLGEWKMQRNKSDAQPELLHLRRTNNGKPGQRKMRPPHQLQQENGNLWKPQPLAPNRRTGPSLPLRRQHLW